MKKSPCEGHSKSVVIADSIVVGESVIDPEIIKSGSCAADGMKNSQYKRSETLVARPLTFLFVAVILNYITLFIGRTLLHLYGDKEKEANNFIRDKYGWNAPCYAIDYYPARQFVNMFLYLFEVPLCFYCLLAVMQTRQVTADPRVPYIGTKWLYIRTASACVMVAILPFGYRLALSFNADENMVLHAGGFLGIRLLATLLEIDVFVWHMALSKAVGGGLPFQEYLGYWSKPFYICFTMASCVMQAFYIYFAISMLVLDEPERVGYDKTDSSDRSFARLSSYTIGGWHFAWCAILYNLRTKTPALTFDICESEDCIKRYNAEHPYGYYMSDADCDRCEAKLEDGNRQIV